MFFLIIGAIVISIFSVGLAIHYAVLLKSQAQESCQEKEVYPFSPFLIGWGAVCVVGLVVLIFFGFVDEDFELASNMGQIGDFVGGLTNPALSFIGLIVLLRTTIIQSGEARKTTKLLKSQQELMEKEKFETTFFLLLDKLESYCEIHLRVEKNNLTVEKQKSKWVYSVFEKLKSESVRGQVRLSREFLKEKISTDMLIGFSNRALRVMRFVDRAKVSKGLKSSYMNILRDSLHPGERIVLAAYSYVNCRHSRMLIRKWGLVGTIKSHCFSCPALQRYFQSKSLG
ncbi:hypothetical protein [Pseudomonas entomophila]|uniref:hypothetical protein n=1 Tax=Pseudomonas entomophila TaxID=312306 RepID=UPI002010AC69|nr:hypothetical protein [Pseudomonas entomophila]